MFTQAITNVSAAAFAAPAAKAGKKVTARSAAAKCVPPATHQQGLRKISSERRSGRAREEEASFFSFLSFS